MLLLRRRGRNYIWQSGKFALAPTSYWIVFTSSETSIKTHFVSLLLSFCKTGTCRYNLVITYSFLIKTTLSYSGFPVHRIDLITLKNLHRTLSKFVDYYIPNKGHTYSRFQFISWRPYKGLVSCGGLCETGRQTQTDRQTNICYVAIFITY